MVVEQLSDHSQAQLRNADVCSVTISAAGYLVDEETFSMLLFCVSFVCVCV